MGGVECDQTHICADIKKYVIILKITEHRGKILGLAPVVDNSEVFDNISYLETYARRLEVLHSHNAGESALYEE
ncbi:hypothetical protein A5704_06505 [Mycobacterium sp. E735]|nr:hypothetical protein A5704_06505 [Mycobacterium sp. E735]